MSDDLSDNRLIRNEQIIRNKNTDLEETIVQFAQDDDKVKKAPIAFICECSLLTCNKRITTTINRYRKLHKRRDIFMVSKGHTIPSIEKVVSQEGGFEVVQKLQLSA
jgi:transketolase N-terminal domain/subunit